MTGAIASHPQMPSWHAQGQRTVSLDEVYHNNVLRTNSDSP